MGCKDLNEILFPTSFSILRLRIHSGEIKNTIISEEFMKRRPNYENLTEFDPADILYFRESESLRKTVVH